MNKAFEVFWDGDCPLCRREIEFLRRRDREGKILFTDIAAADWDPKLVGLTQEELMAKIHGRLPDGTIIEGVEVFRQLYDAVGFHRLVAASRWPMVRWLLDLGYQLFARNRLRLTGRCEDGSCRIR